MLGFTKSLAKEFSSFNIRVNLISPGFIETDMTARLISSTSFFFFLFSFFFFLFLL